MTYFCEQVVMACAYCKTTHFSTAIQLYKHWKQDCEHMCRPNCFCKKCSPVYCETKFERLTCIEYVNKFSIRQDTFASYFENNKRYLFFLFKEISY